MSPAAFLQDPLQWLSAISRYKATTSGGPNFAYELCVRKARAEDRSSLDLSGWRVAFSGAERVRNETIEHFTETFQSCGFRREAFYPCYGLAEATLIVSGGKVSSPPIARSFSCERLEREKIAAPASAAERSSMLVGCGQSLREQSILIVDPDSLVECEPGRIGEIWVSGKSVAVGYWQKPEQTQNILHARTADTGIGPFLRTGDLGFVYNDELFVSGRLKDLIIIGGSNHYPEDIELTVEKAHGVLRAGRAAAFSVDIEGEERLVVVQEVERRHRSTDLEDAVFAIRRAVAEQHGLQIHAAVLIRAGSIPKTSSGKIQRHVCRSQFLEQRLVVVKGEVLGRASPEPDGNPLSRETILVGDSSNRYSRMEAFLLHAAARVLKVPPGRLDPGRSLSSLGIDSLMAVELASQLEIHLQVSVPMASILGAPTFADLASSILGQMVDPVADNARAAVAESGNDLFDSRPAARSESNVDGDIFPVTWQQQSLWLQHQNRGAARRALNILVAVRLKGVLDRGALEQSLNALVRGHAILRTTYALRDDKLVQIIRPSVPVPLPVDSLLSLPQAEREAEVCRRAALSAQFVFNLETDLLLKLHLLQIAPEEHALLLLTHHIACDGWSIRLLLDQLSKFYQLFSAGESPCATVYEPALQYSALAGGLLMGREPKIWETHLQYWKRQLGGELPKLALPRKQVRTGNLEFNAAQELFEIPEALSATLKTLSRKEEVTLFTMLLAAFKILLCRCSQQTDIVVGSSVANRSSADVQNVIGPFTNAVALHTPLSGDPDAREMLKRVKKSTLEACANQEVPFDAVLRAIRWNPAHSALFDTVFLFQNFLVLEWTMGRVAAQLEEFNAGGNAELVLAIYEKAGGLVGALKYDSDLYDRDIIREMVASYLAILQQLAKAPETRLSQFVITQELARQAAVAQNQRQTIAVAATFVPDLVKPSLDFWMKELRIPSRVEFAPYNQVFQQLLDPASLLCTNRNGINVILIRFADLYRNSQKDADASSLLALAESRIDELAAALKSAAAKSSVPYLLYTCPEEPHGSALCNGAAEKLQLRLRAAANNLPNLYFVEAAEILALYPVPVLYDPCTDALGHIPYSPAFFTALGTMIARKLRALRDGPCKVIALDCDQTLWRGICGEDGVEGVEIDPARQALQEFLIAQRDQGTILCLVSKNEEQDVLEVFQRHPGMRLKLDHITARQINWNPKSENLKSLSQQLGLGLDSFAFIDDNPVECAEVEAACPGVLTLQLPDNSEDILKLAKHLWAFDKLRVTEEDKRRSELYQQGLQREKLRSEAVTLSDFISSLELECLIGEMKSEQIGRVAQLTQRTNQFNTTTLRRSESDILRFCEEANRACFVVEARDRFGDYGLVGAMFAEEERGLLRVDSFLLSCRSLGRGIEHQMLLYLGKRGLDRGLENIQISILPTPKNKPALAFLQDVAGTIVEESQGRLSFRIAASGACACKYSPSRTSLASVPAVVPGQATPTFRCLDSKTGMRIAIQLCTVEQIDRAIDRQQLQPVSEQKLYAGPSSPIEETLVEIWSEILRLDRVGIHDNFIELGGHSLLGTVLVSRIKAALGLELPLNVIFEKPTIAQMAAAIEQEAISRMDAQDMDAAMRELEAMSDEEASLLLRREDGLTASENHGMELDAGSS